VQAYLLARPPVSQVANRNAIRTWGPANTTVPIFEQLLDSRSIFLTANDNTVYSWTWLDLHDGPLVVEVPPKVLGAINDMWYRWVIDVGITGPDKGEGGKYLLLPPGYKGEAPEGYIVVRPPTFSNWIPWRSFLVDGDPKPGVELVKKYTRIYPLSQAANPAPMNFVDLSGKAFNTVAPADYTFWELLNQVVQVERRRTGCRQFQARPGTPSFVSTVRSNRGSTRRGGRVRSNSSLNFANAAQKNKTGCLSDRSLTNYNSPHGWYVTTSPIITANWLAASNERWTLPIGGGVGKIVKLGKLPINVQLQAFDNVVTPNRSGPDWQLRFQVQFLFPK
jgi:hypothetical protein